MEDNWNAQKMLAPSSSNKKIDAMFQFAKDNGAVGGKLCGAGGGGAFIFYSPDTESLKNAMKRKFVDCFEIDFEIEYEDIKTLNNI
jgi:D-glycero-alpha-D-manno-heptose-7-phosphate kinase